LITNLESSRGNKVPNQFTVRTQEGIYFQSYDTIIAIIQQDGKVILDAEKWNFSQTTSKYRNVFLGESTKETEAKIKSGIYKLENLNQ
jgi:hypothetical protein